jgi:hypothetical protein
VETLTVEGRPGDLYLVCSDGVSAMLADEDIFKAIDGSGRDPAAAAEALVNAANARGGEDNITVVLFELVEGEAPVEEVAAVTESGEPAGPAPETPDPDTEVARHGAGPGGRAAALLLVGAVLVVGALALYWGITK